MLDYDNFLSGPRNGYQIRAFDYEGINIKHKALIFYDITNIYTRLNEFSFEFDH